MRCIVCDLRLGDKVLVASRERDVERGEIGCRTERWAIV